MFENRYHILQPYVHFYPQYAQDISIFIIIFSGWLGVRDFFNTAYSNFYCFKATI